MRTKPSRSAAPRVIVQIGRQVVRGNFNSNPAPDLQPNLPNIDAQPTYLSARPGGVWPQIILNQFLGREEDLEWGRSVLLCDAPYLALRGLPGVGKTSLALALAKDKEIKKRFVDGLLWAGLVRKETTVGSGKYTNNLETVLIDWACAVGVSEQALRTCDTTSDKARLIHLAVGDRSFLLVIDDVWERDTPKDLISVAGPNCGFVVTTRQAGIAYEIPAAENREVQCLDVETSLMLLKKEIGQFDFEHHLHHVRKLVERAAGLPLALKLIGPFLRSLENETDEAVETAVKEFLLLAEGETPPTALSIDDEMSKPAAKTAPARRAKTRERLSCVGVSEADLALQRLQGHINASVRAVSTQAQIVLGTLCRFSAKPNTFSPEAAKAVAGEKGHVQITELLNAGLIERASTRRYALHQVVVDYGRRMLSRQPLRTQSRQRFVEFYVSEIKRMSNDFDALAIEHCNLLEAMRYAREEGWEPKLVEGVNALSPYILARGLYHSDEMNMLLILAERHSDYGPDKARAMLTLAIIHEKQGSYGDCQRKLDEALGEARTQSRTENGTESGPPRDNRLIAHIELTSGILEFSRCNYKECEKRLEAAISAAGALEPPDHALISHACQRRVAVSLSIGEREKAAEWLAKGRAATLQITPADPERDSGIYLVEGLLFLDADELERARTSLTSGLKIAQENNQIERATAIRHLLIAVECKSPDFKRSIGEELVSAAEQSAKALGHRWYLSAVCAAEGEVYLKCNEHQKALEAFAAALQQSPNESYDRQAFAWFGLSHANHGLGHLENSAEQAARSVALFEKIEHDMARAARRWLVESLMDLAESQFRTKRLQDAASTFSSAKNSADPKSTDQLAFADYGLARVALISGDTLTGARLAQSCLQLLGEDPRVEEFRRTLNGLGFADPPGNHEGGMDPVRRRGMITAGKIVPA